MKQYIFPTLILLGSLVLGFFAAKFGVYVDDSGRVWEPGLKFMPFVLFGLIISFIWFGLIFIKQLKKRRI